MREIVFSNIPVKGRVIYPNVRRFFMVLARLLSSLPIILKLSRVVSWPLLKYYKGYQNYLNCKEKLFPDRPEEAAMFGCKTLSTEII